MSRPDPRELLFEERISQDDDDMEAYMHATMPKLSKEQQKKAHDDALKCADLIRKKGMSPNLDLPTD